MTMIELIKEALKKYMKKLKKDPYYKLTVNVQEADRDESEEVISELDSMSNDDLSISSMKTVSE